VVAVAVIAALLFVNFASVHSASLRAIAKQSLTYPAKLGMAYGKAVIDAANDTFSDIFVIARSVSDEAISLAARLPRPEYGPRNDEFLSFNRERVNTRLAFLGDFVGSFEVPHLELPQQLRDGTILALKRGQESFENGYEAVKGVRIEAAGSFTKKLECDIINKNGFPPARE